MGSLPVVVIEIGLQHGLKVTFADNKDPIETFGPNGPDETLGIAICPRGPPSDADDLDTLGLEYFIEHLPESMVSVVDQETQWRRTGLAGVGQVSEDQQLDVL